MNSYLTEDFLELYGRLANEIQEQAQKAYQIWKSNPRHPSLHYKQIHSTEPIYSVRIARGWRALGLRDGNDIYWFWIGSHADYDNLTPQLMSEGGTSLIR